jgi:hypothetical protein
MSHTYVREQFRAASKIVLEPVGFAWVESINFAALSKDLPSKWFTLEFMIADEFRAALGVPALMRETGAAAVQVFSEQQTTDAQATQAADIVRNAFANWKDVTGQLRVVDCAPAVDIDSGDFRGAFYGVYISVRYQFDRFVDESPIV